MADDARIEWQPTREQSRLLGACQDLPVAVLGGGVLLASTGLVVYASREFVAGNPTPLVLGVVLALVGGPLSLLYLLPMLTDADQRPGMAGLPQSPRRVIGLAVGGACTLLATTLVVPVGLVALVFLAVFVCPPLAGLLAAGGRVNPQTRTLTVGERSAALETLVDVRQVSVGGFSVLWLSYARHSSSLTAPHLVVLPTRVAQQVRPHLRAGVGEPFEPATGDGNRASNRTVQATLVTFGLLFLGVAVGQFFVTDLPTVVAIWASSLLALFALVFLWLAVEE